MKTSSKHGSNDVKLKEISHSKVSTTKKWLKRNFKRKHLATVDRNLVFSSYNSSCIDSNEIPLENYKFLEVLQNYNDNDSDNDSNTSVDLFADHSSDSEFESTSEANKITKIAFCNRGFNTLTSESDVVTQDISHKEHFPKCDSVYDENDSGFESQETTDNENKAFHLPPNDKAQDEMEGLINEPSIGLANLSANLANELSDFIKGEPCDEDEIPDLKTEKCEDLCTNFSSKSSVNGSVDDCKTLDNEKICSKTWSEDLGKSNETSSPDVESQLDNVLTDNFTTSEQVLTDSKVFIISKYMERANSEIQEKFFFKISILLSLENFKTSPCFSSAKKLSFLLERMIKTGKLESFVHIFAHSFSCRERHEGLCFMFKRIIRHMVVKTEHFCAVKQIYGHVFRLHLDCCSSENCGIVDCVDLRKIRSEKRLT